MLFPLKAPFFRAVANGSWLTVAIAFKAGASGLFSDADGGTVALPSGASMLPINGNSPGIFPGRGGSLPPRLLFQDPLAKVPLEAALSNLGAVSVKFQPPGSLIDSAGSEPEAALVELGLGEVMSQTVEGMNDALMPGMTADAFFGGAGSLPSRTPFQDPLAKVSLEAVSIISQPSGSLISWVANQPPAGFEQHGLNPVVSRLVEPFSSGLGSGVSAAASVQAFDLDSASAPQLSIDSANPNLECIDPALVIPEPGSSSLIVVGLAVMGLVYRFQMFPRKFSYFVSENGGESYSVLARSGDSESRFILSGATKPESRSRFDFFAVAI